MKRGFDANVSKARPRTRLGRAFADATTDAEEAVAGEAPPEAIERDPAAELAAIRAEAARRVAAQRAHEAARSAPVEEEDEPALSADLAAALVRPRATIDPRPSAPARAGSLASAAGSTAAKIAAELGRQAAVTAPDPLRVAEQEMVRQAGERAHETARSEARTLRGGAPVAHALRAAAVMASEAAQAASESGASARMPGWVATAAVPESSSDLRGALTEARLSPPPAPAVARRPERGSAVPSADLAAAMQGELRLAARASAAVESAPRTAAASAGLSADLSSTVQAAQVAAARPRATPPAAETLREGKARIEELRQRLDAVSRPRVSAEEVVPESAAAAVRQAVEELRARLASTAGERDALARTLESTRDDLERTQKELTARTGSLEAAEKLAAERARVADDLVAEAEALAEERDRALSRISELKALDEQQSKLLAEAELALAGRDAELGRVAAQTVELTAALDARAAESEELAARLSERTGERDQLLGKVSRLEAEVARLLASREALAEIQRLVSGAVR